ALKVLKEFSDRSERVVAVSSYETVVREIRAVGAEAVNISAVNLIPRKTIRLMLRFKDAMTPYSKRSAERLFLLRLCFRVAGYRQEIDAFRGVLETLAETARFTSVLTINESLPLSVIAGAWAAEKGIPWVGFFPNLLGTRTEGNHFPAPLHLVYGDQL